MHPRIDIYTTTERIAKDFGNDAAAFVAGHQALASYEVNIRRLKSQFARFLVENITSTSAHDIGSRVVLVYAETIGEQKADELLLDPAGRAHEELRMAAASGPSALADALDVLSSTLRTQNDDGSWGSLRTGVFKWPIYGSAMIQATSPEGYFDMCSAMLRTSGAIPIAIGEHEKRPPESLLRRFVKGDILALTARYEDEKRQRDAVKLQKPSVKSKAHLQLVKKA